MLETGNWKLETRNLGFVYVSSETFWSAVASQGRRAWRDTAFLGCPKSGVARNTACHRIPKLSPPPREGHALAKGGADISVCAVRESQVIRLRVYGGQAG